MRDVERRESGGTPVVYSFFFSPCSALRRPVKTVPASLLGLHGIPESTFRYIGSAWVGRGMASALTVDAAILELREPPHLAVSSHSQPTS